MGVETVAVYSEADENSLHVRYADHAVCIGPAQSKLSYLNIPAIISAAEVTDAEAIHPGYGFLAENAHFAELCAQCNIKFIGPSPSSIKAMGDKAQAIATATANKVTTVPGSGRILKDENDAVEISKKIGFPIMIKATAGGGGRGMRIAHTELSLRSAFKTASQEALTAFSNPDCYLEKFIEEPRHVEIQIMCDNHGNYIALGERDCSVQRRHQKLIEESPSPFLTPDLRKKMGKAAVRAAEAADYENAGTIEFLVDAKGNYYFIEMNTRIQVEHPVTEEVTGIDLIKQQIRIANGEKLGFDQSDIKFEKHAIECRINAEDPARNFVPSPGTIGLYYAPGGHGVRVDSHAYSGYAIPPYYDSMIGKLITYGPDRKTALERMYRALSEYLIRGIKTTIPLHKAIMADPVFIEGKATTAYMEEFLSRTPTDLFS